LKDKIKTIKTLTKGQRKQIKNQNKKDQIKINIITIEKRFINLIWRIKLKTIKTLTKESRKKNKKSKVEGSNKKTSYKQIRIEGLY
jgi:hypothetical protein